MPSAPRKAEKPLICFLRLHGTAKKRMEAVCRKYSTTHNDVARAGTLKELLRLETHAGEIDAEVAKAIAEARQIGVDPVAAIRDRIAALLESRAPAAAEPPRTLNLTRV